MYLQINYLEMQKARASNSSKRARGSTRHIFRLCADFLKKAPDHSRLVLSSLLRGWSCFLWSHGHLHALLGGWWNCSPIAKLWQATQTRLVVLAENSSPTHSVSGGRPDQAIHKHAEGDLTESTMVYAAPPPVSRSPLHWANVNQDSVMSRGAEIFAAELNC